MFNCCLFVSPPQIHHHPHKHIPARAHRCAARAPAVRSAARRALYIGPPYIEQVAGTQSQVDALLPEGFRKGEVRHREAILYALTGDGVALCIRGGKEIDLPIIDAHE